MSDFIFSKQNTKPKEITKQIQSIYNNNSPDVIEFHGHWGSLGVSNNLYYGFNPYENEEYIVVVIGGPILTFRDNSFINDKDSSEGTIAIFNRWIKGEMKWDKDISGPFVTFIVNKKTHQINCTTDLMSFIPVYFFHTSKNLFLSTHVDSLARISGQDKRVDEISEIDFILHGVVTYPYTSYKSIYQLAPASEHVTTNKTDRLKTNNYWVPREKVEFSSINSAANQLRQSLKRYMREILSITTNVAQFISGGEDSRTISALLQYYERDAFIFLDHMNREGKIAQEVARVYNANFNLVTRKKSHYLDILPSCSSLVGSGSQYQHAHTYGFHKSCKLYSYSAIFGGLLADALLKGSHIKKVRASGKLPFIPEIIKNNYSASNKLRNPIFKEKALDELTERRRMHLNYIRSFREETAEEWFELWPSSMNANIPNIHVNRRLFRSYEPFLSNDIVKISAVVPQKWKLNRRLFHKMSKPLLKPTKWLQHGDGWYPYYAWHLKSIVYPVVRINRKVLNWFGLNKGNQGPWFDWDVILSSEEWSKSFEQYALGIEVLYPVLNEFDLLRIINSRYLTNFQRINLLQTLYMRKR